MIDNSIFEGVVLFNTSEFTYQAILQEDGRTWGVAEMGGKRIVDIFDVKAPADAYPSVLLNGFFKAQAKAIAQRTNGVTVTSGNGIWRGDFDGYSMMVDSDLTVQSFTGDKSNTKRSEDARKTIVDQIEIAIKKSKKGGSK